MLTMIQQIILPYIILDKLPKLINNNIIFNQTNIMTQYYINNIQTKSILEVLDKCENKILTRLLNILNNSNSYYNISNKYLEYLEILNIQLIDINQKIEIMFYTNNEQNNILHAVKDICKFKNIEFTIKENNENLVYNEIINKFKTENKKTTNIIFYDLIEENIIEYNEILLNLSNILYNLKLNGNLILCLNDTHTTIMIDILFLLNILFKKVYISRPLIMNTHNKYRYVVCKNLQHNISSFELVNLFNYAYHKIIISKNTQYMLLDKHKILDYKIPVFFKHKLNDINCIYGQQILENTMLFLNNKQHEIAIYYKNLLNIVNDWIELHKIYLPFKISDVNISNDINLLINNIIYQLEKNTETVES